MGKGNMKDYATMCRWFKKLSSRKPTPLLPENKEDRLKKFTNFSLYHIMDKYEFVPNFFLQTEYLYPLLYKNPEVLKQSYFNHHKFSTVSQGQRQGPYQDQSQYQSTNTNTSTNTSTSTTQESSQGSTQGSTQEQTGASSN